MDSGDNHANADPPTRNQLLLLALLVEGGMLVLALGLAWLVGPPLGDRFAVSLHALLIGSVIGVTLLIVIVAGLDGPFGARLGLRQDVDLLSRQFGAARIWDLLLISILAGVGEELLFRGILLHHGAHYLGLPIGIALTSLLFGLLHALSLAYVVFTSLLGVLMCALYLGSGNLLLVMSAHATYDFAALVYLNYFRPPRPSLPA